ncbi:septum formation protein Maf [Abditibacteriota bacterium]|nr:septum formation protein Maf [Abditibacteriota bacterium]
MPRLVLASASPRRSQLLRDLGLIFTLAPTQAEEPAPTPLDGAHPHLYVERLARIKATACSEPGLVIAADTVVVFENEILNKPRDAEDAFAMLCRLRGQTHRVLTGVCLRNDDQFHVEHEATHVTFGYVSDDWIRTYVQTGEPLDKAGAYGAQGRGSLLVSRIEGDYFNVVGLPIFRLSKMLAAQGIDISREWTANSEVPA